MKRIYVFAILTLVWTGSIIYGHGGRTDSYGCHRDTAAGNYHCHTGESSGKSFASQAAMLDARSKAQETAKTEAILNAPASNSFIGPYDRSLYGGWIRHADGDCQDTSVKVLVAETFGSAITSSDNCRVIAGRWYDPFVGKVFSQTADVTVEHYIPLAEVHRSGGEVWSPEKRQLFANDLSDSATLITLAASTVRSRGDKDPAQWLPPNPDYQCVYVLNWMQIKTKWKLSMDGQETNAISVILRDCEEAGKVAQ
jgi:hypothetical protein